MTENDTLQRRDFLKLVGLGAIGAAGCAPPSDKLIPYLVPPRDITPGIGYWYASTCRECPASCGILVKSRDGRAIKIEGNPEHPVSRGGVCARGHAGLQGLYDPDRVRGPMKKEGGAWQAVTWDEALALAAGRLKAARAEGKQVALVTENATGSFESLARDWAKAAGGTHLVYEPFNFHPIREANRRTFGQAVIPQYDLTRAHGLMTFGADFLETWLNPVGFAREFTEMRAHRDRWFVAAEPRLSLTAANADRWIALKPGGEMSLALAMAHVILAEGIGAPVAERGALIEAVRPFAPEAVADATDVDAETIRELARRFARSSPSLALAGGVAAQSEQAVAMVSAVNLLNYVAGNVGHTVRFDRTLNYDAVASITELQQLAANMSGGSVGVLMIHGANPVYAAPGWTGFTAGLDAVPFKISLSTVLDETTDRCDLILPGLHSLESLGDANPARGVNTIVQPAMKPVPTFHGRHAGDTLIELARQAGFGDLAPSWSEYLKSRWRVHHQASGAGQTFDAFWDGTLARGGVWTEPSGSVPRWQGAPTFAAPALRGAGDLALVLYPSMTMFDGRGANKGWLQELPDVTTKAVWGSWVEIHPEKAKSLGIKTGDAVTVSTETGSVTVPAYLYEGIRQDAIALPLGQGHTAMGRYAKGQGVNAVGLLTPVDDAGSGAVAYLSTKARVSRATEAVQLVRTQRHMEIHGREVADIIPLSALMVGAAAAGHGASAAAGHGAAAGGHGAPGGGFSGHVPPAGSLMLHQLQTKPGKYTEPRILKEGEKIPPHAVSAYQPKHVVRSPRQIPVSQGNYGTAKHRWAMAIDLDRCNGCSACVTACNAENNIPIIGPEHTKRGREMTWLRIERFEEKIPANGSHDVRFLPMMCQHCSDAPCETVCPVYATYHNPEGLNAQIYNRCVGTRYCSNNCPYKVRAFNFFDYAAPEKPTFAFAEPLNWQLNPDVTVRSKGVMEKCTMCVQRILEGKGKAKDETRDLRDGEFTTACAQSCPTQAIVFGDLMDPESAVSKASNDGRRYWVLGELNTKPGVTYLKKIRREETA
jgi:anaerobic selenocysteine-containing dehydrogenase/Fe-S-cluster-containing dehydrogenase component